MMVFDKKNLIGKLNRYSTICVIFLYGILYFRYDSGCYMDAEIKQKQAIVYFNSLISRIQSIDDYKDDYPVVFVNEAEKKEYGNALEECKWTPTNPYDLGIINSYNWRAYMKIWCNYFPETKDATDYIDDDRVVVMPSYPDDGSICIIDDVIVVKF